MSEIWREQQAAQEQPLEDRWCGRPGCGGELMLKRRLSARKIITLLLCPFCGWRRPTLSYDRDTGEHEGLLRSDTPR